MPLPRDIDFIEKAVEALNSNRNEQALTCFNTAITANKELPALNYGKAIALARLGQVNDAIDVLKEMLTRVPGHEKGSILLKELASQADIAEVNRHASSTGGDTGSEKSTLNYSPSKQSISRINSSYKSSDEVHLVSYPKSGNTWLRFLLANLQKSPDEEIDFHTVHQYIPEVGQPVENESGVFPKLLKSHSLNTNRYDKVIYLVRDGRDVYVSYYFHRLKELPEGTTFRDFIQRQDHYPCLWGVHVASWALNEFNPKILLVKYEDMISDCHKELRRIIEFIGLDVEDERLAIAVQNSSFDNMRRIEKEKGRKFKDKGPELFTRSGKPGEWKKYFGPDEKRAFKSKDGDILIEMGYESNLNW